MEARGSVFKYGDNIDTDVIIPARYLNTQNARELADHCMEDIDKTFITRVQAGDIMVGGENFGCGSSREHAPLAIKTAGIACVIAASFARIFYRNAINMDLKGADTFFLSCMGLTTMEIIDDLETALKIPVVTSHQATLWSALRHCRVGAKLPKMGRLFTL